MKIFFNFSKTNFPKKNIFFQKQKENGFFQKDKDLVYRNKKIFSPQNIFFVKN